MEIINSSGQILELSEDVFIPVERYNSLFNTPDKIEQDLIYPAKTGLTDRNKIFIGSGHLIEAGNDIYSLPVQVIVSGINFFSGTFNYRIIDQEIDFDLRVNLGSIANKMKESSIREIYTQDSDFTIFTDGALSARMKDTCETPLKYPYVFFPVWSNKYALYPSEGINFINLWDYDQQKFLAKEGRANTNEIPFWRLTYVVEKILEYLKFTVVGDYFSDPEEQEIYLFNLRSLYYRGILPSTSHLPNLKISEFFKQIIERRRIAMDIDVFSNTINVITAKSMLSSQEYIDISDYVQTIQEISVPEKKGYKITLKINQEDEAWNTGTAENKVFQAPYILNIGNGENIVEMAAGTLKRKDDPNGYSYPMNLQLVNYLNHKITPEWPVTLLRYKGMKQITDGKVFPEALPLDLDLSDAVFPQFLNDSKPVVLIANIPPNILARMKPTIKLGFISNEGTFFQLIPEKISFNLAPGVTEFVRGVKIEGRVLKSEYRTAVTIQKVESDQIVSQRNLIEYKAHWDPEIHAITQVRMERIPINGSKAIFGFTTVKIPCDESGVGGSVGSTWSDTMDRFEVEKSELRLFSEIPPRYFIRLGVKKEFVEMPGYYKFPEDQGTTYPIEPGDKPILIVF